MVNIERINKVIEFMDREFSEDISLDILASVTNCSKYHFSRIFVEITGFTPMAYLTQVRLKKAFDMLTSTDLTIADICSRTGYNSVSGFYGAFEKKYHVTPGVLRSDKCRNTLNINSNIGEEINDITDYSDSTNNFIRKVWNMNVVIKELPRYEVAYVRKTGSYLDREIPHWEALVKWSGDNGLFPPENLFMGTSLDDPAFVPEDECRHDACITLPEGFDKSKHGDVGYKIIEGGLYGVYQFYDIPEKLALAYTNLNNSWLPQSNYQRDDRISLEINLNNPKFDPEGKCKVDLCIPIREKRE